MYVLRTEPLGLAEGTLPCFGVVNSNTWHTRLRFYGGVVEAPANNSPQPPTRCPMPWRSP